MKISNDLLLEKLLEWSKDVSFIIDGEELFIKNTALVIERN
jgi:hypothetical protein